jgi:regulatory protein
LAGARLAIFNPPDVLMMSTITALTLQKRNRQRVSVFLDGEYAFGLARIVAAWLEVGQELSDEKIAQLRAEDEREVAYQRVLRLIQYRPRSENEIRQLLRRHATPEGSTEEVIERLKQSGLIDDPGFAQAWVENRADLHPRSRRALAYELSRRGIDAQVIEESLTTIDDDAMAYQAAQRPARRYKDLEWNDFRQKIYRYLAQRGFNYEASAQAISRIWQENHSEEPIPEEEEGF